MQEAKYEQDFLKWTEQQADYLRGGDWANLDVENLVEELESLGRSEQRELGSQLQRVMMHLLKYQYQLDRRTRSWKRSITDGRDRLQDCIEDVPSLKRFLQDAAWIEKYYHRARRDAAKETQLSLETFPEKCPYSIEQILSPEYLP